jgi:hypothetical protein
MWMIFQAFAARREEAELTSPRSQYPESLAAPQRNFRIFRLLFLKRSD